MPPPADATATPLTAVGPDGADAPRAVAEASPLRPPEPQIVRDESSVADVATESPRPARERPPYLRLVK